MVRSERPNLATKVFHRLRSAWFHDQKKVRDAHDHAIERQSSLMDHLLPYPTEGSLFEKVSGSDRAAYSERFNFPTATAAQLVNQAIASSTAAGESSFVFLDIYTGDPNAPRQIILGNAPSIELPQGINMEAHAVGLVDVRKETDREIDNEHNIHVIQDVIVTPEDFNRSLSAIREGSANVIFVSPQVAALDIPDVPDLFARNLNILYRKLSTNNGVLFLELEFAEDAKKYKFLKRVRRKLRRWAKRQYPGINIYWDKNKPATIAIVKTPQAPENLPNW